MTPVMAMPLMDPLLIWLRCSFPVIPASMILWAPEKVM